MQFRWASTHLRLEPRYGQEYCSCTCGPIWILPKTRAGGPRRRSSGRGKHPQSVRAFHAGSCTHSVFSSIESQSNGQPTHALRRKPRGPNRRGKVFPATRHFVRADPTARSTGVDTRMDFRSGRTAPVIPPMTALSGGWGLGQGMAFDSPCSGHQCRGSPLTKCVRGRSVTQAYRKLTLGHAAVSAPLEGQSGSSNPLGRGVRSENAQPRLLCVVQRRDRGRPKTSTGSSCRSTATHHSS